MFGKDDDAQSSSRIISYQLPWSLEPENVLRLVRQDSHPVALVGEWAGGGAIIGSEPIARRSTGDALSDVFAAPDPARPAGGSFGGGWIGYLGYGLIEEISGLAPPPGPGRVLPTWWFGFYDNVLHQVAATGEWFFEALWTPERADALESRRHEILGRASRGAGDIRPYSCSDFQALPSRSAHIKAVERAIQYIREGDIFQANICMRLEAAFSGDSLDLFCRAVSALHAPYAAYLRLPGGALASMSPELFLRRRDGSLLSKPIKGTAERSDSPDEAGVQRAELEASSKNRSENVMIVDLMRNDFSRICAPGTVEVPRLLQAEPHPGLWHLISNVQGALDPGLSDDMLIRATFPPGSITGAPKVRAMEIIHELETTPREVYTGAIGYTNQQFGLELNVAIRTFEMSGDRTWLGVGGGIVADSEPFDEWAECMAKAAPLIAAIGGGIKRPESSSESADSADAAVLRPRPAAGIFTSMLVTDGQCAHLGRHLARLERSTRQLYGKALPPGLYHDVSAALGEKPSGRLRIEVRPLGGPISVTVSIAALNSPPATISLRSVQLDDGLGSHKWTDRRWIEELRRSYGLGPSEHLLLHDANGRILETDRANIFVCADGILRTPAADGRFLVGVARQFLLDHAHAHGIFAEESLLTIADLADASDVFVTNAVYGLMPVDQLDGRLVPSAGSAAMKRAAAMLHQSPLEDRPAQPAAERHAGGRPIVRRFSGDPSILVIDNYDSFTYNLVHMLLLRHCHVDVVHNDEVTADQVAASGVSGVVISPGPCAPEDAGISIDVVRQCPETTPLLGICLGHQAIVSALGGTVCPAPVPVHGKAFEVTHDGRGLFTGLPSRFQATRYHSLIADESSLPASLKVSARTADGLIMAVRHQQRPMNGMQFHPESILTPYGQLLLDNFISTLTRDHASAPGSGSASAPVSTQMTSTPAARRTLAPSRTE
ncbi:MAG TPA: aminodeoxychorismate synthase component I [Streptosporangiaceae bacterium]|nr:aminodeoxychorismate synthase component I [Streptosporangiaceae bacterium]